MFFFWSVADFNHSQLHHLVEVGVEVEVEVEVEILNQHLRQQNLSMGRKL